MRTFLIRCIALSALVIFCTTCGFLSGPSADGGKRSVSLAGSTSIMPFSEKLAERFMLDHPEIGVDVQGGGSSAGIQACLNKTVDIGMSSRELKGDEKVLTETTICYDGISIVVSPKNPIRNITAEQIRGIYSGRIRNWKELGWIDREIDAVTREEGSGTRAAFEELLMKKENISDRIMVQDSNGSVKEIVATDPYGIGYISLGMLDQRVKALSVDGTVPLVENIKKRTYHVVRPFLYLTLGEPSRPARMFIEFILSRDGQAILRKEGLVPIHG
jgi:phosphate transport system substrate-binding protein